MQDFAGEDLLRSGVLALSCVDQICVNTVVYVFFSYPIMYVDLGSIVFVCRNDFG